MGQQNNVRVDLTIADEGGKRMDAAPNGASIGAVSLKQWQVDRIEVVPGTYDGYDAYHIKINYDLELEHGFPRMSWFEVSFDFSPSEDEQDDVVAIDALPRSGTTADVPRAYTLNRYLNFVPCQDAASAHAVLPAYPDGVDAFGIGGQKVRWRHVSLEESGICPGSYAAWLVLLVPRGRAQQRVEFSARFGLAVDPRDGYWPTQTPAEFHLSLAAPPSAPGVLAPSLSAPVEERDEECHPSVFICYAHDSIRHKEYARKFGDLLIRNGVDVHMDQYDVAARMTWAVWAFRHINESDFVTVLASPVCRAAFDGDLEDSHHFGIRSEARVIAENLHRYPETWTARVLPVVLPNELVDNLPRSLQPWTMDHYEIDELTSEGIDELLRAMTGVPRHPRPPLGRMPRDVLKPPSDTES